MGVDRDPTPRRRSGPVPPGLLWLLGLYCITIPVAFNVDLPGGEAVRTGPSDLVVLAMIVLYLPRLWSTRAGWTWWHLGLVLLAPLSALVLAVSGTPVSVKVLLARVAGVAVLLVLYGFIVVAVRSWADIRRLMRLFVVSTVIVNLVVTALFLARVAIPLLRITRNQRLAGSRTDPNSYGSLLVIALLLTLVASLAGSPLIRNRVLRHLAALSLLASLVLTGSRTAALGLVLGLIVLAAAFPKSALRYFTIAAVATVVVMALLAAFTDVAVGRHLLRARSIGVRIDIIRDAGDAFLESPIVGIGVGEFKVRHGTVVHNTALGFLAEYGLIGFAVFAGFQATMLRWALAIRRRAPTEARGLALALGAGLVAMLGISMGIDAFNQREWWLLIGLVGAAHVWLVGTDATVDVVPAPVV